MRSVQTSAIYEDYREVILRREAKINPDPRTRMVFERLADRLAQTRRNTVLASVSIEQRRALLVSAAVLMDQALRLLDEGGSSIAAVWLSHAIECLNLQMNEPD